MSSISSTSHEQQDLNRYKIANKITFITILINILLAIVKVTVGILSNSSAILADGMHTISDIGSSIGIIVGFIISKKPEDIEHQYGHEKAESVAAFVLSIFLTGIGIRIGYSALQMIFQGSSNIPGSIAGWVAFISIFVKELQYRIAFHGGTKINSSALIADAWHHRSDAFSSVAALIGIVGARLGYPILDSLAAVAVSIIVIKVGLELFLKGYNELMDSSIAEEDLRKLTKKILLSTDILNINEIKARKHGSKIFIDVKVCVDSNITVKKGHDISEDVEEVVHDSLPNVKDVLVHVNPCSISKDIKCEECNNKTTSLL